MKNVFRDIGGTMKMCTVAWGTPLAHYVRDCKTKTGKLAHKISNLIYRKYNGKEGKKDENMNKYCIKTKSWFCFKNKEDFNYFCSNSSIFGFWDFK